MPRYLVTTIRRHTPPSAPSGFLYVVEPHKKRALQQVQIIEPAYRELDANPRGGMRGCRGIAALDDQIAIANASVIYRFDPHWKLLGLVSHPSAAAIHDILFQDGTLWATAARNDLLFQFSSGGDLAQHSYLRDPSPAIRTLDWQPRRLLDPERVRRGAIEFRDPRTHNEETYDHAHLNSVAPLPDGGVLASLGLVLGSGFSSLLHLKARLVRLGVWSLLLRVNRGARRALRLAPNMHSDLVVQPARARSAVVRIQPDGEHRLVLKLDDITVPSHSLLTLADGSGVYLNTTAGEVVHFDPGRGEVYSITKVTEGFLRGVTPLDERRLLLGSKRELLAFDLRVRRLVDSFEITQDPNESVYGVKRLPDHYDAPPASLEERFAQEAGFPSAELPQRGYQLPRRAETPPA